MMQAEQVARYPLDCRGRLALRTRHWSLADQRETGAIKDVMKLHPIMRCLHASKSGAA